MVCRVCSSTGISGFFPSCLLGVIGLVCMDCAEHGIHLWRGLSAPKSCRRGIGYKCFYPWSSSKGTVWFCIWVTGGAYTLDWAIHCILPSFFPPRDLISLIRFAYRSMGMLPVANSSEEKTPPPHKKKTRFLSLSPFIHREGWAFWGSPPSMIGCFWTQCYTNCVQYADVGSTMPEPCHDWKIVL